MKYLAFTILLGTLLTISSLLAYGLFVLIVTAENKRLLRSQGKY